MEINFLIFFIRYYLYRNLKVEGSLKWKWSLVSFTIKCYNSTKKNCMLRLNNQIVRYTGKNPSKSVGTFLRGVNFIVHGWSARNERSFGMQSRIILLFFSVFALLCWAQLSSKKCFSTLTKFPPFCTVHTNINKSFNSFYILHNIIYVLWKVSSMSS